MSVLVEQKTIPTPCSIMQSFLILICFTAFESARGYPIERGAYIQALHKADREQRTKKYSFVLCSNYRLQINYYSCIN